MVEGKLAKKIDLTQEDREFIQNEQILSRLDAKYWAYRYCLINYDAMEGGGAGPLRFWEPQTMLHEAIGKAEEKCYEQRDAGHTVDGIRVVCNKARAIGFTMSWRMYCMHRLTLHEYSRGIAASLNADLIHEVYYRDKMIYDNLPSFLKPAIEFDVKDQNLSFKNSSRNIYQESTQKGAMGISRQFEVGHLTEVSQWEEQGANRIKLDLLPAVPYSIRTLFGMEAVPCGRGDFWHTFTEDVRHGKHPSWIYVFIPWYSEPKKYRRTPPSGWTPSEAAMIHAKKVHETSHLYTKKPNYWIPKDNLYWWETERESYRIQGDLNYFLTNFSAHPEESFQHAGRSAFPVEYLERIRNHVKPGVPYDVALSTPPPAEVAERRVQ